MNNEYFDSEKLKKLLADEGYVKELLELDSYEAVSEKLTEDGVDVGAEDLKKAVDLLKSRNSEKLDDDALENVQGGCYYMIFVIIGEMIASGVGAAADQCGWSSGC